MSSSTIKKDILNIPNLLTMARIVVIPITMLLVDLGSPTALFAAAVCFGLAGLTDFFDGWLARRMGLVSVTGQFLDPLADKLMVMACIVQLAAIGWLDAWIPIVILSRELAIQGLRQIASAEGYVISARTSGKWKTAFQFNGIVGLLVHYTYPVHFGFVEVTINFHRLGWWMLVGSIAFSLWSAFRYFMGFLEAIQKPAQGSAEL